MGSNQSQETKTVVNTINNIFNSYITNIVNDNSINCQTINTVILHSGGNVCGKTGAIIEGSINIVQNGVANCKLDSTVITKITAGISNDITDNLRTYISQSASTKNGWFEVAFSNQAAKNLSVDSVTTSIVNQIQTNLKTTCKGIFSAYNNANLYICGIVTKNVNITQDASIIAVQSCFSQSLVDLFTNNTVLNTVYNETNQHFLSQQSGIFTGAKWVLIIAIIAVALIIILPLIALFRNPQSTQIVTSAIPGIVQTARTPVGTVPNVPVIPNNLPAVTSNTGSLANTSVVGTNIK